MAKSNLGADGLGMQEEDSAKLTPIAASPVSPSVMRVKHGKFEAEGPATHVAVVSIANKVIWALVAVLGTGSVGATLLHWLAR
jgi:hypothetical protein